MHLVKYREAQTAEKAKSLSKTESCDWMPVIDLQMPASRNLAVNRNINQFQPFMVPVLVEAGKD